MDRLKQVRTAEDVKRLGNILGVWAHPDDESFLAVGLMMAAVHNGQEVCCVTATKGEMGVQDESRWPADQLGDIRAREMNTALNILGIKQHKWLGYCDGTCEQAPEHDAVKKLEQIVRKFQPDTILTFGPDGWTGHPDHASVSRWVDGLKREHPKLRIFHVIHTPEHYDKYYREADEKLNIFYNIDMPPLVTEAECDIYFELPPELRQKKCAALRAQESQTSMLFDLFDPYLLDMAWGIEAFVEKR